MAANLREIKTGIYELSDMLGDTIITLIGFDSIIEYAEENGINIVNLYKFDGDC